jgi:signal transduction histidine kinase
MKNPWKIWCAFAIGLAAVFAAMGYITLEAARMASAQADDRRQAAIEENVRLALWRMDSSLAVLTATESSRPYFDYVAFHPAGRAYGKMFEEIKKGDVLIPSPLFLNTTKNILIHFQFEPNGALFSPQFPNSRMAQFIVDYGGCDWSIQKEFLLSFEDETIKRLASLTLNVNYKILENSIPLVQTQRENESLASILKSNIENDSPNAQQAQMNRQEYQSRARSIAKQQSQLPPAKPANDSVEATVGPMKPLWAGDALILARRAIIAGKTYFQGCRLDWDALKKELLEAVKDLLPNADIATVKPDGPVNESRMLTALPVKLVEGQVPVVVDDSGGMFMTAVAVAWVCLLLGSASVAFLLFGAIKLSERRAAFVSAVTHELRTPLTTFRMYSEMLAEGMVEEGKRKTYLETLTSEADRLSRIVENVLAFSRIERGRATAGVTKTTLGKLLGDSREYLEKRAAHAGMTVEITVAEGISQTQVLADESAVAQILFNLVDNAAKYAAHAENKTISIQAFKKGKSAGFSVRDFGPGIAPKNSRILFQPFRKIVNPDLPPASGVGLGLALSRRLARQMNGGLFLDASVKDGACFVFTLPTGRG